MTAATAVDSADRMTVAPSARDLPEIAAVASSRRRTNAGAWLLRKNVRAYVGVEAFSEQGGATNQIDRSTTPMKLKFFLAAFAAFALLIAVPQAQANCDPACEHVCGDGHVDEGEQCDDGNRTNGDGCSSDCEIECGGEGCTPGYWKQPHHLDSWQGVGPDDNFNATFNTNATFDETQCGSTNPTLLQALQCQGGGLSALARHAVAALLNAYSGNVDYDYTVNQVKEMVKNAIDNARYTGAKNRLAESNELGCPLN